MFIKIGLVATLLLAVSFVLWLKPKALEPASMAQTLSAPANEGEPVKTTAKATPVTPAPSVAKENRELILEETVNAQFTDIASQFADLIQYPSDSLPIFDASAVAKYQPNRGAVMHLNDSGIDLSLQTTQLRFSQNDNITGRITVAGMARASVELTIVQQGQQIAQTTLVMNKTNAEANAPLTQTFDLPALGTAWIDPQLLLVARVTNSTQEWTVSTPIERFDANQATAELAALEPSYVQGAWLMIPVRVAITRTGYYRLEANLYAQQDQRPLLHLSAEEEYGPGTQTLFLRAHISALKAMGDEGDYTLSDILLEQMPSAPDFETLTGLTSINSTAVNGYPFADYRDEPYQDEDAQARLEFLQSVANK